MITNASMALIHQGSVTGVLSCSSCTPAVKSRARKDAGSGRSRRLRARLRTRREGALQRPGECEMGRRGPSSNELQRRPPAALGLEDPQQDVADGEVAQ